MYIFWMWRKSNHAYSSFAPCYYVLKEKNTMSFWVVDMFGSWNIMIVSWFHLIFLLVVNWGAFEWLPNIVYLFFFGLETSNFFPWFIFGFWRNEHMLLVIIISVEWWFHFISWICTWCHGNYKRWLISF